MSKRKAFQGQCAVGPQGRDDGAKKDEYHRSDDIIKSSQVSKWQRGRYFRERQSDKGVDFGGQIQGFKGTVDVPVPQVGDV